MPKTIGRRFARRAIVPRVFRIRAKNRACGIKTSLSVNNGGGGFFIMQLTGSKTLTNLARAFAGECQAHVRYKFIEYGARVQGYSCLAEVIDKIVYNEFNHARMFYTFIQRSNEKLIDDLQVCGGFPFKEKWDLVQNLRLAAEDEEREFKEVYPSFRAIAMEEGFKEISDLYDDVMKVEACHFKLFSELHERLKNGTLYKRDKPVVWKCSACGYESESAEAWEKCPLCNAPQGSVLLSLDFKER